MINIDMTAPRQKPRETVVRRHTVSRNGSMQKQKGKIKVFRLILLSFLFSALFLFFENRDNFLYAVRYLFNIGRSAVVYDTYTISFEDDVPEEFKNLMVENLSKVVFNEKPRFKFKDGRSDLVIGMEEKEGSKVVFSQDFIPVGHMYSLTTNLTDDDIKSKNLYMIDGRLKEQIQSQIDADITVLDGGIDSLVAKLKESDDNIGLLSFDSLDYRVKIIPFNEKYYLDDQEGAVKFRFYSSVKPEDELIISIIGIHMGFGGSGVMQKSLLTKLNMGGVVAIARNLAFKMEAAKENDYAAKYIGDFLADADLTHVSNEVSFVPGCTPTRSMAFCSNPKYIETLKKSGVDIVELTGNHNNDYGAKYSASTIETYKELGWDYFGGGLDLEDARKILYKEVNGTKIAFLGYNYYDSILNNPGPLAGTNKSGANPYSEEKLKRDIEEAKKNADVVITSFQFQECYCYPDGDVIFPPCYKPVAVPDQRGTFKKAIDLGADIVVGTQAHQPQTYELYKDGVIFYGLGNLFFDQYIWIGTRQGLVLTHYFYEGKYIQTKVVPIYMDKDFRVRLATKEQSDLLLKLLRDARDK